MYGNAGLSRSQKKVAREVEMAMQRWDHDGSGVLDIFEFIDMICGSDSFKLRSMTDTVSGPRTPSCV